MAAEPSAELEAKLSALPGDRYCIYLDQQLAPAGGQVPAVHLPAGPWTPLIEWLQPELPAAMLAADRPAAMPLQLIRGGEPCEAALLLTSPAAWRSYADAAPRLRLEQLSFAMHKQRVLVRGAPLPPLPGKRFIETAGVATPAGYIWSPQIDAQVVRSVLQLTEDEIALMHEDGAWDRIEASCFVQATRAAIRASTIPPAGAAQGETAHE